MYRTTTFILLLLLAGCSGQSELRSDTASTTQSKLAASGQEAPITSPGQFFRSEKQLNGIVYSAAVLTAEQFLLRKGERISPEDKEALAQEQVVLLEFSLKDTRKDLWTSDKLTMSREEAANYLAGKIGADIAIEQAGKNFLPNGYSFEGMSGGKIRTPFFFKGLDMSLPMTVKYYDALLGGGMMRMVINER